MPLSCMREPFQLHATYTAPCHNSHSWALLLLMPQCHHVLLLLAWLEPGLEHCMGPKHILLQVLRSERCTLAVFGPLQQQHNIIIRPCSNTITAIAAGAAELHRHHTTQLCSTSHGLKVPARIAAQLFVSSRVGMPNAGLDLGRQPTVYGTAICMTRGDARCCLFVLQAPKASHPLRRHSKSLGGWPACNNKHIRARACQHPASCTMCP